MVLTRTRLISLVSLSALIAGYIEVICLYRFRVFSGFMTGNLLQMGTMVVKDPMGMIYPGLIVVANFVGVLLYCILKKYYAHPSTLITGTLIVILIGSAEILESLGPNKWHVILLALAMGAQNHLCLVKLKVPTTIATGALQSCANVASLALTRSPISAADMSKLPLSASVVIFTVVGALGGGLGLRFGGVLEDYLLLLPALLQGVFVIVMVATDDVPNNQGPSDVAVGKSVNTGGAEEPLIISVPDNPPPERL